MTIKKIALLDSFVPQPISPDDIAGNSAATKQFEKVVASIKNMEKPDSSKRFPARTDDFNFSHAIMMHAAEASLIDQETGELLKNAKGESVQGGFVEITDHKGRTSLKWESPDNIKPYANGNGDIFPESELLKAYKDWIGKPLCQDHVSDTIDGVRGVIIDTYYDPKFKRVHALFALDKKNYAELARKVEAGYATDVSMGTAVGESICTECGNVATVEAEFCSHVRNRTCYGEINRQLSPIELSIVVTGADPRAKIRTVLAHLKEYENRVARESKNMNDAQKRKIAEELGHLKDDLTDLISSKDLDLNEEADRLIEFLQGLVRGDALIDDGLRKLNALLSFDISLLTHDRVAALRNLSKNLGFDTARIYLTKELNDRNEQNKFEQDSVDIQVGNDMEFNPGLVDSSGDSLKEDLPLEEIMNDGSPGDTSNMSGLPRPLDGVGSGGLSASLYSEKPHKTINENRLKHIDERIAAMENMLDSMRKDINKEKSMTFADLKKKALDRKHAYPQGSEDPESVLPYERMGDDHAIRENQDKQMVGEELDTAADNPDMEEKKMLQRAELEKRMANRANLLRQIEAAAKRAEMKTVKNPQTGEQKVIEVDPSGKVTEMTSSADDGKDKKRDKKKEAYMQGTEEPQSYSLMGDQDGIRERDDRHMLQTGPMGGDSGLVPGDEALKRGLQRIAGKKLSAKFFRSASKADSRWDFFAGSGGQKELVLSITAKQAYGDVLDKLASRDVTFGDFFHSKPYGNRVMKLIRAQGPMGAMEELGLDEGLDESAPEAELAGELESPSEDPDMSLRDAVSAGIEKLEVALEEIKSAVAEEPGAEGLEDLEVNLEGGEGMPAPEPTLASVSDKDMLEAYAFMVDMAGELAYLESKLAEGSDKNLRVVARDALGDAKASLSRLSGLVKAYRVGKIKRAMEADCGDGGVKVLKVKPMNANDAMYALDEDEKEEVEEIAEDVVEEDNKRDKEEMEEKLDEHLEKEHSDMDAKDGASDEDEDDDKKEEMDEKVENLAEKLDEVKDDVEDIEKELDSLAARKAWRQKLLARASQYDDVYEGERSGGGPTLGLDGDDKVETLHETHQMMKDIATKNPGGPSVREAAAKLDKAIKSGGLNPDKLGELVAIGQVDPEAANYWKTYFGEADGGSEFAAKLVGDFEKSASADSDDKIVRYKRAYIVGMAAQEKNLIAKGPAALNEYVDNLAKAPDYAFASIKNIVEQTNSPKTAVAAPQVGLVNDENGTTLVRQASDSTAPTFENLSSIFLK